MRPSSSDGIRWRFLLLPFLTMVFSSAAQQQNSSPAEIEKRVEELLGKVTLEEKISLLTGKVLFRSRTGEELTRS